MVERVVDESAAGSEEIHHLSRMAEYTERDKKTQMKQVMDGIVAIDKNDVNLNAFQHEQSRLPGRW